MGGETKMAKKSNVLSVSRETVRVLNPKDLRDLAGGEEITTTLTHITDGGTYCNVGSFLGCGGTQ
jgi:hypothetical protein